MPSLSDTSSHPTCPLEVVVVGAGPVGCAAALGLAQRGCHVQLCDGRNDPRPSEAADADTATAATSAHFPAPTSAKRSINLAISTRGLAGLSALSSWGGGDAPITVHRGPDDEEYVVQGASLKQDLAQVLLDESLPMRGRMIHTAPSRTTPAEQPKPSLAAVASEPGRLGIVCDSQAYAPLTGDAINSLDRGRLNNVLIDAAAAHPLIDVCFGYKFVGAQLDTADPEWPVRAEFDVNGHSSTKQLDCDTLLGCDGHHSRVRAEIGRHYPRLDFEQLWIDSGYVELSIPPRSQHPDPEVRAHVPVFHAGPRARLSGTKGQTTASDKNDVDDTEFLLDPNHLHIWPRHQFMLIALPNRDGSFTCTLFAPFAVYARHLTPATLAGDDGSDLNPARLDPPLAPGEEVGSASQLGFFREFFPDAVALITEEALVRNLSSRRPNSLGVVRCAPYNYKERALILGDAAHAMVPFYGQGLNAGLEDVRVLLEHLDAALAKPDRGAGLLSAAHTSSPQAEAQGRTALARQVLREAYDSYATSHAPDSHAIVDLALNNYHEMASKVVSLPFRLRRQLDATLMALLPSSRWQSLYTMVTFSTRPYEEVVAVRDWQDGVVRRAVEGALTVGAGALLLGAWTAVRAWAQRR